MPWPDCEIAQRTVRAHVVGIRRRWERFYGMPWPVGLQACHRCDEPRCANPLHIFLGTQGDNLRDAHRKGHLAGSIHRSGERHRFAKLTDAQADELRRLRALGLSQPALARRFGINQSTVSRIVAGRRRGGGPYALA
jgi:DNA-binding transcriptional regulator YiaG